SEGNLTTASGYRLMGYTPGNQPLENTEGINLDWSTGGDDALQPLQISNKITVPDPENEGQTIDFELQSYNVDNAGYVTGTYSDGKSYVLGRVALTSFTNPNGLEKTGANMYKATANSGEPNNGGPSDAGFGIIRSGFLEMSN